MTKLTGAALDRAVANAMGLKSVHNCEQWGKPMTEAEKQEQELDETRYAGVRVWVGNRDFKHCLTRLEFTRSTIEPRRLLELVAERCIKELTHD
jgi:hypothetical protein